MTKEELFKDVDFMDEVLDLGTAEEVQKKFSDKGVEISIDEVEEIGSIFNEAISNINSSELSDDALSAASGGVGNETKVEELNIGGRTANSNGAPAMKLFM